LNSSEWQKENQVITIVCTIIVLRFNKVQTRYK